ncbi:hypothetical protein NIE88_01055 [Sporolactobacillus shoreicorticis]|uniref:Uncharacterized protein n=1 Tax=Sporolactobacillus shoreicorticis TaxID=1923877 RepID=A0ABW5S5U1_9BACL|nr:hypothetical protein [Sporolactobacillus shoreicorticis]MCO7124370.1 hypothetical protein [Sporolactobacillus shoreicorticis]
MKVASKKNALRLLIGILIVLSVLTLYFSVLGFRTSTLNRGVPIPRFATVMKADQASSEIVSLGKSAKSRENGFTV